MSANFSFDNRVAQRYNAQRAHPPQVSAAIGAMIAAEAGAGARVLEIGVGTGRIAHPVAATGCRVVGFDISAEMLREVGGGERPLSPTLSLLQADLHDLPFVSDAFDAVLAVHVLHLARDLPKALTQIARSLRPGGAFIQGDDWIDPQSVVGRLRDELRQRALALSPNLRPPSAGVSKQQFLADLGGDQVSEVVAAEWTTWISPAERLEAIANKMDAESWFLPDEMFAALLQQLQDFAAATWPDLDQEQPVTRRFVLKLTRGDWV
jgi:SAM-dependent methyltransferase